MKFRIHTTTNQIDPIDVESFDEPTSFWTECSVPDWTFLGFQLDDDDFLDVDRFVGGLVDRWIPKLLGSDAMFIEQPILDDDEDNADRQFLIPIRHVEILDYHTSPHH